MGNQRNKIKTGIGKVIKMRIVMELGQEIRIQMETIKDRNRMVNENAKKRIRNEMKMEVKMAVSNGK